MTTEEKTRSLRGPDVTIEVETEEDPQSIKEALNRPVLPRHSRPSPRRSKVKAHLEDSGRRLAAFAFGLVLASLYGLTAFYLQKQSLWFSVYSTMAIAGLAAFGMGLSAAVRVSVMVMLPALFSSKGRKLILLLFSSVLVSGPITNTLENVERAAASVMCGAELAANQTQRLLQRSATPLLSALDKIQMISRNAYAVAGRVQKLMYAMTDGVRHIARTLRNVLHFLADIGDVCNDKLGSPFRKCRDVFLGARRDCDTLLGEFNFLCAIVEAFLPLCHIARAGELFCIIPSYISSYLKEHLAAPTIAAFDKLRQEFDFNISASFSLDVDADSSQSLQQATQSILRDFSSELEPLKKLGHPLAYISLFLLAYSFYRAVVYRFYYLHRIDFDNFYISAQFKQVDHQTAEEGGVSVLPITRKEAKNYITPMTCRLTLKEWKAALKGVSTVLRYLVIGCLVVALDFLLFWILDQVNHQVKADVVARAPVQVSIEVNGSGFSSSIIRDLISSFDILQKGNITVISRKCLKEPSEPDWTTCFILGFLLGLALLASLTGGSLQRCRRIICAAYYPEREQERIRFLHQKILDERRIEGDSGRRCEHAQGSEPLASLLRWLPGGHHRSERLGRGSSCSCVDCRETDWDISWCAGVPCSPCFLNLGSTCVPCVRPQASQEGEAELGSDEEHLRRAALGESGDDRENQDNGSIYSDAEISDLDMSYQYGEVSESNGSDSDDSTVSI